MTKTRKLLAAAVPIGVAAAIAGLAAASPRLDSDGRPLPANVRSKGDPPPTKDGGK
jgi:hypothetical protein